MSKKNQPGMPGHIPHLLQCAFAEAKEGDREAAMRYWDQAIEAGYEPRVKTKRQLMYTLRIAGAVEGNPDKP